MTERGARTAAQAKINLILRVGALLPSGYHDILTLFQRIDLSDEVEVRAGDAATRSVVVRNANVGPPEENLAWKAGVAFEKRAGWPRGFAITIDKKIPAGGGLGGGSADAAAVLRILNSLAPEPFAQSELEEIALTLGSDVPFLTTGSCLSLAGGRGERMLHLAPLPARDIRLFLLPFPVATKDAYLWIDESRTFGPTSPDTRGKPGERALSSWSAVRGMAENDFENVVAQHHPQIGDLLNRLRHDSGNEIVLMSGSGSTVFAVLRDAHAQGPDGAAASGTHSLRTRTAVAVNPISRTGSVPGSSDR